jgi:hypothetical protein
MMLLQEEFERSKAVSFCIVSKVSSKNMTKTTPDRVKDARTIIAVTKRKRGGKRRGRRQNRRLQLLESMLTAVLDSKAV